MEVTFNLCYQLGIEVLSKENSAKGVMEDFEYNIKIKKMSFHDLFIGQVCTSLSCMCDPNLCIDGLYYLCRDWEQSAWAELHKRVLCIQGYYPKTASNEGLLGVHSAKL